MEIKCQFYWMLAAVSVHHGRFEDYLFPEDRTGLSLTTVPLDIPVNVDYLDLSLNDIETINATSFHLLVDLEYLRMNRCNLKYIENATFDNNGKLHRLALLGNSLEMLPVGFGLAQTSIVYITLYGSLQSPQFRDPYFVGFSRIRSLNLGNLFFGHFNPNIIPNGLLTLTLSDGCLSKFPNISHVSTIEHLEMEWMCMSEISHIYVNTLRSVQTLHMSGNKLNSLPDISFMSQLTSLKLSDNNLTSCPDLYDLPLAVLELASNPLTCDASLCWIRMSPWMKPELQIDDVTCIYPGIQTSDPLMDIHPTEIHCYEDGRFEHLFTMVYQKHATGMTKSWILQEELTTESQLTVRSKVECATLCWESLSCIGVIYQEDGACLTLV